MTSYDQVPYESIAFVEVHPDRLAVVATLFGMAPPPVAQARVLELGCASGGNLIPMAVAVPEGRFVGIDLSARQVAEGRRIVEHLGLKNIELEARSIADLDAGLGPFDYILCHGVYSWVPEPVRAQILSVCARHLAPDGIALVSYNTYPGWHFREAVRKMMLYRVRGLAEPIERARVARDFLETLVAIAPDPYSPYARALADELGRIRPHSLSYLLHEHLEADNQPVYYHEFVAQAAAHGLKPLGDARFDTMIPYQPPAIRANLERLCPDPADRDQYLDFLYNRAFRRTLLCRASVPLAAEPDPMRLSGLRVAGALRPEAAPIDPTSREVLSFRGAEPGQNLSTADPWLKTALVLLLEHWPHSIHFPELLDRVGDRLGHSGPLSGSEDMARPLATSLLACAAAQMVSLRTCDPPLTRSPGEHPTASPYVRLQAETGAHPTNLLHRHVSLSDFDRLVLRLLDGRRDRATLLDELVQAVVSGSFTIQQDGRPLRDEATIRPLLARSIEPSLNRLAHQALLLA
ncbi:MAG: class I SAM-dependent methyltransferase [Isosphaeraceae bacterium]|nr:class I SAM-dependent methyltransferase [Isosphaeraceae bacterium]